jgi:hypothetical protein
VTNGKYTEYPQSGLETNDEDTSVNNTVSFTIFIIEETGKLQGYIDELREFIALEFGVDVSAVIVTYKELERRTRMRALGSGTLELTFTIVEQTQQALQDIEQTLAQIRNNRVDFAADLGLTGRNVRLLDIGPTTYSTLRPPSPPPSPAAPPPAPSRPGKSGTKTKNKNQVIDGVVACARDTMKYKKCDKRKQKNLCDMSCQKKRCKKTQRKCKSTCANGCVPGILPDKGDPDYVG